MNRNDFHETLNTCIALEELAIKTYKKLEKHTDPAMHALWKRMSLDETAHLKYWKSLLTLAEKGEVRNIFDDTRGVLEELRRIKEQVILSFPPGPGILPPGAAFLIAYRVEFYMMHPSFEALFGRTCANTST